MIHQVGVFGRSDAMSDSRWAEFYGIPYIYRSSNLSYVWHKRYTFALPQSGFRVRGCSSFEFVAGKPGVHTMFPVVCAPLCGLKTIIK